MSEPEEIKEQLRVLVEEKLQPVTYKWLARNNGLPANLAKQHLFAYAESRRGQIDVTYLLAGWTEKSERHMIQLIGGKKLKEAKGKLSKVTSLHVYSIQPSQPKDPSDLWNADVEQTSTLFDQMVKRLEHNCLSDNNLSAVYCPEAERDLEFAKRQPALPQAEPQQKPKSKSGNSAIGAKIDGIMAGRTANRGGVASTSLAVGGETGKAQDALTNGPSSAPAGLSRKESGEGAKEARITSQPKGKSMAAATKPKGKGSALGSMWSKAPAKSAAAKKPPAKGKQSKPVDAEAALKANIEEDDDSSGSEDEDEEDFKPARRGRTQAALLSDEESKDNQVEEKKEVSKKAAAKTIGGPSSQQQGKQKGAEKAGGGKSKNQQASRKRKPAGQPAEDDDVSSAQEQEHVSQKKSEPKYGAVKAGKSAGSKRQKVQRTIINDDGEEVTEDVWEEADTEISLEEEDVNPSPDHAEAEVDKQTLSKPEVKPEQPEQPASKPPNERKGRSLSPPAKKAAGSKKSAAGSKAKPGAAQKNIMSFFGKK